MNKALLPIICALCLWGAPSLYAAGLSPAQAQALLPAAMQQTLAMPVQKGRFTQSKRLRELPSPLLSSGQFLLSRSKGVDWVLEQPFALRYTLTASGLTEQSAAGSKHVDAKAQPGLAAASQLMLALFTLDFARLAQDFEISGQQQSGQWQLTLQPRNAAMAAVFAQAQLQGSTQLGSVLLTDARGDTTRISFKNLQTASTLSAADAARFAP